MKSKIPPQCSNAVVTQVATAWAEALAEIQ